MKQRVLHTDLKDKNIFNKQRVVRLLLTSLETSVSKKNLLYSTRVHCVKYSIRNARQCECQIGPLLIKKKRKRKYEQWLSSNLVYFSRDWLLLGLG